MNTGELLIRKDQLLMGLDKLNLKVTETLKMVEVQKGAISECGYWIEKLEAERPAKEENNL